MSKRFELYIKKKLMKGMTFDLVSQEFKVAGLSLTNLEKKEIIDEGKIHYYSEREVEEVIGRIIKSGFSFNSRVEEKHYINTFDIPLNQHIKIKYHLGHKLCSEELLRIDSNEYLLINHEGEKLIPGDILKPQTYSWSTKEAIEFEVFRDGRKISSSQGENIYTVKNIVSISLVNSSELFDLIENEYNNSDFIFAYFPNDKAEFEIEKMSHKYGENKFYKINRKGGSGTFSFVTIEDTLKQFEIKKGFSDKFDINEVLANRAVIIDRACDCENDSTGNTTKIVTVEEGNVLLNRTKSVWEIKERAIIQFG